MLNNVYESLINQFKICSILDLKIKWKKCFDWLANFSWVSRSFEAVSDYLSQKGLPYAS